MFDLAAKLGHEVEELRVKARVRGLCIRAQRRLLVAPSGYAPRDEFTLAHEMMELYLPREWLELPEHTKELLCDRGAAALLLPRKAFLESLERHGWNVEDQRRLWPHVSATVIEARINECLP
jgi:Zn-dependent peptidase ImmA (M78 family)